MSRCKESAGFLFPRKCDQMANRQCGQCARAVCQLHHRDVQGRQLCISCVRAGMRDQQHRGSYAHLADDPYFYWYYHSSSWFEGGFTAQDYALFDDSGVDFDAGFEHDWGGS